MPVLPAVGALAGWRLSRVAGAADTAAPRTGAVPRPVSLLGLRTPTEETCAEAAAAVRLRARTVPARPPEALADAVEVPSRGEPLP